MKSFARFARNTSDSLLYIQNLRRIGVNIIFENERIQTKDVTSDFMITIYSAVAQEESEEISSRAKWNWRNNFKQGGVHISYGNFLGYLKGVDGKPEVDIDQGEIVRRIYTEYLFGKSFRQIAKGLQNDNILSPEGKNVWSHSSIRSILKNEKYAGEALLQKSITQSVLTGKENNVGQAPQYYVQNSHPAIIDKDTWTQAQEELAKRSSKPAHTGKLIDDKYPGKFALSGLLFCGECGTPYRRCTWSKGGQKTIIWRCISRLEYGTKYCKTSPTLKEDVLHDAILGVIVEQVRINTVALSVLKQHVSEGLSDDDNAPYMMEARIGELQKDIDNLYAKIKIPYNGEYEGQFEELYTERNALKEKLIQIKAADANQTSVKYSKLDRIFAAVDELCDQPLDWDEEMIWQMIECIRVIDKKTLGVRFRWGDEIEVKMKVAKSNIYK